MPESLDPLDPLVAHAGPPTPPARAPWSRLAAWATAGALLFGGAAAAGGYAIARAAVGSGGSATAGGSTGRSGGSLGGPGAQLVPRRGGRSGFGTGGTSGTADATYRATAAELVGLVRIVSTQGYQEDRAAGTGLVLTSGGEVVTNHHVVAGATRIRVTVMSTGRTYPARLVGSDAAADVAVLRLVGAHGLPTVSTDARGVSVGQAVTAVGDGGGTARFLSAADGTVLARRQAITTHNPDGSPGEHLRGLIEISSDVVSGYSGGATYDSNGDVVGLTTAASTGGNIVGFAIPIGTVLRIASDLEGGVQGAQYAYGRPAFLGVGVRQGTVVEVYDGTPAAAAGIAPGDRITAVGSVPVSSAASLRTAVTAYSPGNRVSVTWIDAAGGRHVATVTLASGPVA